MNQPAFERLLVVVYGRDKLIDSEVVDLLTWLTTPPDVSLMRGLFMRFVLSFVCFF